MLEQDSYDSKNNYKSENSWCCLHINFCAMLYRVDRKMNFEDSFARIILRMIRDHTLKIVPFRQ